MSRAVALGLLLAAGAGCVSLAPRPDHTRHYVLEPQPAAPEAARAPIAALGLGPVRLPAYLDRRELVTRRGPVEVNVASADRWAAPLEALFASALAEDLRAAVPAQDVVPEPWPAGNAPEWIVSVEVLRFEGEAEGTAVLEARWTVRRRGAAAAQGVTVARERGGAGDVAATVAALGRTLGALARDVAAAVGAAGGDRG